MKKVILTGPESSGKTTLAQKLSTHLKTGWLPEYAREYLENLHRNYTEFDLYEIAKGQFLQENKVVENAEIIGEDILIYDTSFLVLKIWSMFKYGRCHPFIIGQLEKQTDVFYILCGSEIPWEFDSQRENPDDREHLYHIYKGELERMNVHFIEVAGSVEERLKTSLKFLTEF